MNASPAARPRLLALLGAVALALAAACAPADREPAVDLSATVPERELSRSSPSLPASVFSFGFDRRASPREDARQYIPFLAYLEAATGYAFELRFTPKGRTIADELGRGRVHFAAVGAGSYVQARDRYGVVPLVRGVNAQGTAEYRSVLVTAADSPVQRVEDLRGHSFAFGSFLSTQGHLIPRIIFREHGFDVGDLGAVEFTGSHRNTAEAVATGRLDAGGMQDTLGEELSRRGLLRILYRSRPYPSSGIAAAASVPAEARERVRQALLRFAPRGAHAAGLYHWGRTEMPNGFVAARDEDYAELRDWMKRLGLLEPPGRGAAP